MGNKPSTDEECDALIPKGVCGDCDAAVRKRLKAGSFVPPQVDCFAVAMTSDHEGCVCLLSKDVPLSKEGLIAAGTRESDEEDILEELVLGMFQVGTPTAFRLTFCTPDGDVNRKIVPFDPFAAAALHANARLMEYLLDHHGYDANGVFPASTVEQIPKWPLKSRHCTLPLQLVCLAREPVDAAKMLLKRGASPLRRCSCCPEALSPLMLAVERLELELLVLFLADDRIDVNVTPATGDTALACAVNGGNGQFYSNEEVVSSLLSLGAAPTTDISREASKEGDGTSTTRLSTVPAILQNPIRTDQFVGRMLAAHSSVPRLV